MTAATSGAGPGSLEVWLSPGARHHVAGAVRDREPMLVHRRLPAYAVTPLIRCPGLAAELGVREVWAKDETWRLGLPSFKMLGASYAAYRALTERLGREVAWDNVGELRAALAALRPFTLAAATDGNHGRAVARMARLLGLESAIYVPDGTVLARIRAIESEGARVTVVPGDYDAAVRRSAADAGENCLVISDTSWPGYTRTPTWVIEGYSTIFAEVTDQLTAAGAAEPDVVAIPVGVGALAAAAVRRSAEDAGENCLVISDTSWPGYTRTPTWVIEGYSTIFAEVTDQLTAAGAAEPDVVAIPVGVGALAAAAVRHFKPETAQRSPFLVGVEPASASCVLGSLLAGQLITVPGPHPSIMAGLNCGTPSRVAWPFVSAGFDAMVAISDEYARRAMRSLAAAGIPVGETGAAALGGLLAVTGEASGAPPGEALRLGPEASVLLLCTEGATDPQAWEQIVGRPPPARA